MGLLSRDIRFSLRLLIRKPGFTLIGILTLALGIGANTALFSLVEDLLLRPLPFRDQDQVLTVWRVTDVFERSPFSIPTFKDIKERNRGFEAWAMYQARNFNLVDSASDPERLHGLMVTSQFTQALGVHTELGRGFSPRDDLPGAARSVMISRELWQRRMGGDPQMIGQDLLLNNQLYTLIGVYPAGLRNRLVGSHRLGDLWVPTGPFFDQLPVNERENRGDTFGVARLKSGWSFDEGSEDLRRIGRELQQEFPLTMSKSQFDALPIHQDTVGEIRPTLLVLMGTVGFVLLLACANLAHLLLARFSSRRSEFATRAALGASRNRLIAQSLTETVVLVLLGSLAGLGLAKWAAGWMQSLLPQTIRPAEIQLSWRVLSFSIVIALLCSLLIGLLPALQASRSSFQQILAVRSTASYRRWRFGLVAAQLSIALTLLIGSFLMLGTIGRLGRLDPGFRTDNLLTLKVTLPVPQYVEQPAWLGYFDRGLARVQALAGVENVAVASAFPLLEKDHRSIIVAGDRPVPPVPEMSTAVFQSVSPGFFQTLKIPLRAGRLLANSDHEEVASVAIINERLARHFWPDSDPVGQRIAFEFRGTPAQPDPQWRTVVGVVGDVRHPDLEQEPLAAIYTSIRQPAFWYQGDWPTMIVAVRSSGDPMSLAAGVRSAFLESDPQIPLFDVKAVDEVIGQQLGQRRLVYQVLGLFAALAVILATVGVYGVVSYSVSTAARDIGIRLAIGARPGQVLRRLLVRNMLVVGIGIALGLIGAAGATRWLSSLLFGVGRLDPWTYVGSSLLLAVLSLLAILIPALQVMRVDPAGTLRRE